MKSNEDFLTKKTIEAVQILYKSVKERKIKEVLDEIKNGGQDEKYRQRIQN